MDLSGEGFPGGSAGKESACSAGDLGKNYLLWLNSQIYNKLLKARTSLIHGNLFLLVVFPFKILKKMAPINVLSVSQTFNLLKMQYLQSTMKQSTVK